MADPPDRIVFEGKTYRLSGNYYRRNVWGSKGPSNLHRAVWEKDHGPVPEGCEIHHKDGNPFNNALDNLECVGISEHQRGHTLERLAAGKLKPPSELARKLAAEWHGSEEGRAWHVEHGRETWADREWGECICQQCGRIFRSPFPSRAKWCHPNCKAENLRQRRGVAVGLRPERRKPRVLSGRRDPGQQ